jgi:hypothetical protein
VADAKVRNVGAIGIVFGAGALMMGGCATMVVGLQKLMLTQLEHDEDVTRLSFERLHALALTHLPLFAVAYRSAGSPASSRESRR